MKKQLLVFAAFAAMVVSCTNNNENTSMKDTTSKEEKKELPPPPPLDSVAQMKAWQDYSSPSKVHEMIASWNGIWNAENTQWMDSKAPPAITKGTATNKMILGGRFQEMNYKGEIMGMPFEGIGTLGYDNALQIFTSTWIDNMGTGVMTMEGQWDEATKTINFKGKSTDPMTKKTMDMREVFTVIDANNQKMEMFGKGMDGKEFKMMEIKFTRKK